MVPLWFLVVFMVFMPIIILISVFAGAYLMWAKSKGANPMNELRMFMSKPQDTGVFYKEEDDLGFYD